MTSKQLFSRIVLVLGLISMFLVWMPGPGQCETVCGTYVGDYSATSGWDTKVSRTGRQECTLTATKISETGVITRVTIKVNWNSASKSSVEIRTDGTVVTETYNCDPPRGRLYCDRTSATWIQPDGSWGKTTYGPDGKAIAKTRTDGKTGEVIVYNCHLKDVFGKECVDLSARERQYGGKRRATPRDPQSPGEQGPGGFESATNAPAIIPGLKPVDSIGARDKVQADVLQQIEGKPRGDLGARERPGTGLVDPSKVGPAQVKPKGEDLAGPKAGVPAALGDRFKKMPGDAVGLSPQPLQPGPSPDKSIQLKDTTKLESGSAGHKEKLRVPLSQSAGQTQLQGVGAAKQKVQTQAVQPFKGKAKTQDFRSPAGSPGAYPGLR